MVCVDFLLGVTCACVLVEEDHPGGSEVKHLPAIQETWFPSTGREDPLEKEMATHSNTFAWKMPWTEEPGRLHSMRLQRVLHD